MNARLFEDEPQCNISPLPKPLFDVGGVPETEINQITVLFLKFYRDVLLLFFLEVFSSRSCLDNAHQQVMLVTLLKKRDSCCIVVYLIVHGMQFSTMWQFTY